ncbi:MAG: pyridoxal-phosphate-dependent aminotransferase family protein [Acidobacteriota bacterium]
MSDRQHDIHLFIPGPAGVTAEVMEALGRPIAPHYGGEFVAAYNRCVSQMQEAFQTTNDVFLIVGPGTACLDAAFTSAIADGARVLVPSNGWFGDRLAEMCRAHRAEVERMDFPRGGAIDAEQVVERIRQGPRFAAVCWIHHETSTGVLNPVEPIAAAAREHGALSIIDAVASLGGTDLPVDRWGVDLCISVSNKCLAAPPGISAISVSAPAWDAIDANEQTRGWYLDLKSWRKYRKEWAPWHPYPTTVSTNVIYALSASLQQILAEGLTSRIERTAAAAHAVRSGLRQLGFEMYVEDDWASPITTSVKAHPALPVTDLQRYLRQVHGIYISGGIDELSGLIFRIGHMGRSIERAEVENLLHAVEGALRLGGVEVAVGTSLEGIWAAVGN